MVKNRSILLILKMKIVGKVEISNEIAEKVPHKIKKIISPFANVVTTVFSMGWMCEIFPD